MIYTILFSFFFLLLIFIKRNRFYANKNLTKQINEELPRFVWIVFLILTLIPIINILFIGFLYAIIIKLLLNNDMYYKLGKFSSKLLKPF